jgi:chromosome segregation ATPase
MIDINKEAEKLYPYTEKTGLVYTENDRLLYMREAHINAVNKSKATQAKVLQAQIDLLNSLGSKLQGKVEHLKNMASESQEDGEYFTLKISGLRLAKEEIRGDLKELQQQLKELENEI